MEEFESKAISTAYIYPGFGLGMWMKLCHPTGGRKPQVPPAHQLYTPKHPVYHGKS